MTADDRYDEGLAARRSVLGDAWVDRSLAKRNGFNTEFQEMITRIVWGEIWTRPGLDHKTRRCMVLSTMIALGRWEEFKLHVRAGLAGGLTVEEIKEIILQATLYCGVPAGNHAMGEAESILRELGLLDGAASA
ncbi:carboxymuconolactone decarboxylase family protein [Rhodoplanes roseus]|uniref:Gamma-carboxymuconolactone decarboxylase n=1 Tax=Rhodoplanes roseus TaxID=29409 RepID=A0A327KRI2_9BRAD|nr:carboxymuconolactone decarboxylase family protein [Rhodoplanes roseus]RAI41509.1 gamma-carboxymuconolactone decarboxylase [Rhodoplanes roseus]